MALKHLHYSTSNILRGALIYSAGDSIAAIILDEFSLQRLMGMVIIGATVYAFEIPTYFSWIDRKTISNKGTKKNMIKTALAIAYFNPIWIWRHLVFIKLFTGDLSHINLHLWYIASMSFLVNIPISILANYTIQNKIHLGWRFLASALFSALMAIYYALSETLF